MAEIKTRKNDASVAEFIKAVSNDTRRADAQVVLKLMQKITGKKPKMWGASIIGFDEYHYKYASGHEGDAPLTAFSPRKQNLTIYLMSRFAQRTDLANLLKKLGKYKTSVSCLYITRLSDVDLTTLEELIGRAFGSCSKQDPSKNSSGV